MSSISRHKFSNLQVTVDFLGLTVTLQQATEDAHASHPDYFLGHTGVGRTLPLSCNQKPFCNHKFHNYVMTEFHRVKISLPQHCRMVLGQLP